MSTWTLPIVLLAITIYLCRHHIARLSKRRQPGLVRSRAIKKNSHNIGTMAHLNAQDNGDETTPKAEPVRRIDPVPTMVLGSADIRIEHDSVPESKSSDQDMPPPRLPVPKPSHLGVQRAPVPSRLAPAARVRQSLAPSLAPTSSTMNNARGKVVLAPGHSPLDWAALSRSTNLSGVPNLQRVTPSMLKSQHGRKGKDAWSSYRGKVYNISPYLPYHPGGEGQLLRAAGKDGTKLFEEAHAWVNWDNMMSSCIVGIMVPEAEQGLDDLD